MSDISCGVLWSVRMIGRPEASMPVCVCWGGGRRVCVCVCVYQCEDEGEKMQERVSVRKGGRTEEREDIWL